jgi:hypothetical protein
LPLKDKTVVVPKAVLILSGKAISPVISSIVFASLARGQAAVIFLGQSWRASVARRASAIVGAVPVVIIIIIATVTVQTGVFDPALQLINPPLEVVTLVAVYTTGAVVALESTELLVLVIEAPRFLRRDVPTPRGLLDAIIETLEAC